MPRVALEAVTKVFTAREGDAKCALSEVSLVIEERECLVIVGPSGSGKTTALRLIAGLEQPTSGSIFIGGKSMNGIPPKDRDVAMIFQNPALYPHMSVRQNLAFGLRLRRWPRQEADARVKAIAESLGLSSCLNSMPASISGGQRQRIAIGRALVRHPGVLLLDEPLANVDPPLRAQLRTEITALRKRFDTTIVYVTHDHLEAMLMGDRVGVLHEGVLQQVAEPLNLYRRPANLFVATFIGYPPMNLLKGNLSREAGDLVFVGPEVKVPSSVSTPVGTLRLKVHPDQAPGLTGWINKPVVLGIRPEDVACTPGTKTTSTMPGFVAKVLSIARTGAENLLSVSYGENSLAIRLSSTTSVAVGQEYGFTLDAQMASYFDPVSGRAII